MTTEQMRARLTELRSEGTELTRELGRMANIPGELDPQSRAVWMDVSERAGAVADEIAQIEGHLSERSSRIEQLRTGATVLATGDGARGVGEAREAMRTADFQVMGQSFSDPWDYSRDSRALYPSDGFDRSRAAIEATPYLPDYGRERAMRVVEREGPRGTGHEWALVASNPDYVTAFTKLFEDPERGHLRFSEAERAAYAAADTYLREMNVRDAERAMGEQSGAVGQFMVPISIDPSILLSNAGTISSIRQVARVEQITTMAWRGITSAGAVMSWDPEGSEVSDDSPSLGQPTVTAWRAAGYVPGSLELFGDVPTLVSELSRVLSDGLDRLSSTAFSVGTGSSMPWGSVTALQATTTSRVATQTGGAFGASDVYAALEALPPRWRRNATFHASLPIIDRARRFSEGLGYNSTFLVDLGVGSPPRLLGKMLLENSEMLGVVTTGSGIVQVGDYSQYLIADRVPATIDIIPHMFGSNGRPLGMRGVYMYARTGGDWLIRDAGRLLVT
jgi:HK97 family phage major capsid protein